MIVHRLTGIVACATISGALLLSGGPAFACGWWGDGEAGSTDTIVILPGGIEVAEQDLSEPETMARLARVYRLGDGVATDLALARSWAERAARAGHAGAMNDLGQMLEAGIGGPVAQNAAAHWYREAALRGFAAAQHSLAIILEAGRGLPADMEASNEWLRKSAAQGHATAAVDLANRLWAGRAEPKTPAEGCPWWLIAVERGHLGTTETCLEKDPGLGEAGLAELRDKARRRSARMPTAAMTSGGDS